MHHKLISIRQQNLHDAVLLTSVTQLDASETGTLLFYDSERKALYIPARNDCMPGPQQFRLILLYTDGLISIQFDKKTPPNLEMKAEIRGAIVNLNLAPVI